MTNALLSVLVVARDDEVRGALTVALASDALLMVVEADGGAAAVAMASATLPSVVVGDSTLVADRGIVQALRRAAPHVGIVVQARDAALEDAVLALRARVDEFFPTSVEAVRLRHVVRTLAERTRARRDASAVAGVVVEPQPVAASTMQGDA